MFLSKQELSVKIAEVYRVQVDDMDFAIASKDQVLEKFAADSASPNKKYTRLRTVKTHGNDIVISKETLPVSDGYGESRETA